MNNPVKFHCDPMSSFCRTNFRGKAIQIAREIPWSQLLVVELGGATIGGSLFGFVI